MDIRFTRYTSYSPSCRKSIGTEIEMNLLNMPDVLSTISDQLLYEYLGKGHLIEAVAILSLFKSLPAMKMI